MTVRTNTHIQEIPAVLFPYHGKMGAHGVVLFVTTILYDMKHYNLGVSRSASIRTPFEVLNSKSLMIRTVPLEQIIDRGVFIGTVMPVAAQIAFTRGISLIFVIIEAISIPVIIALPMKGKGDVTG